MVTALVVARARGLGETVRISRGASATGGGGLDLRPGDRYTVSELLYALLLSSSNDAAVALAEHVAGSEIAFVRRMNALAEDIGALRSHFVTSHGLDVAGHYSTARDLARIALAVLRSPALAPIVGAPEATITGRAGTIRLENSNPLIDSYSGAIGVKTGYTSGAGDVLVAAAHRGGRRLIAVAMGSDDAAADVRALLDYGFDVLGRAVLLQEGSTVGALVFDPSGSVGAVAARTIRAVSHEGRVAVTFSPAPALAPPFAGGEPVGTVILVSGAGRVIARAPAVADEPVVETDEGEAGALLARLLRAASSIFGSAAW
ncbi:MAG: serine hydrolase [Actinomycetota bacterium]|nr:serine hydrolase [Actinomycetota bacterium]